jgi:hypothetical protein
MPSTPWTIPPRMADAKSIEKNELKRILANIFI